MFRRALTLLPVVFLAACAQVDTQPASDAPEIAAETPSTVEESPKFKNSTLKYLAGRNLKPQPTRPLNVKSKCSSRDAIGTQTRLDLLVKDAVVKNFDAQVTMKGHGTCRFNLNQFDQAEKLPQALLRHKTEKDCTVRMWEQGSTVTVAFNNCQKSCDGQAFDYLWPVVVDARSGRCH